MNECHDAAKMQDMLDGFIKMCVLCEKCDYPETVLKIKKNMIDVSCRTCGHIFTLDMRHKLTTFIIKNPPEKDVNTQGRSQIEKKERDKEEKTDVKKNGSDDLERTLPDLLLPPPRSSLLRCSSLLLRSSPLLWSPLHPWSSLLLRSPSCCGRKT